MKMYAIRDKFTTYVDMGRYYVSVSWQSEAFIYYWLHPTAKSNANKNKILVTLWHVGRQQSYKHGCLWLHAVLFAVSNKVKKLQVELIKVPDLLVSILS